MGSRKSAKTPSRSMASPSAERANSKGLDFLMARQST